MLAQAAHAASSLQKVFTAGTSGVALLSTGWAFWATLRARHHRKRAEHAESQANFWRHKFRTINQNKLKNSID